MKRYLALFLLCSTTLLGQSNTGELRIRVTDPSGSGVKSSIELVCDANQFRKTFVTDDAGAVATKRLPFGVYRVQVDQQGFAPFTDFLEIRSAVPTEYHLALSLAAVNTSVTVQDTDTLVDPHRTGTINRIGSDTIEDRSTALPGRSVVDLVNSQPGWLYEGNAVLHPRGSEYQTQFVVDGVPLTDNRSPSFGTQIDADDVQSMSIYTANIPAEYGRKLGGVIEVATTKDARPGFHGKAVLSGGSFGTADAYLLTQYAWGKNTLGVSADGAMTHRFLNPPVVQNYTNVSTNGDFAVHYERDITDRDRLSMILRHALSRFEIPNELLQQAAHQRQDRGNFETTGVLSYQHIFTPNVLGDLRFMARDDTNTLSSSASSTPIVAFQDRGFREEYLKASASVHHGIQEWKAGVEADFTHIHEQFSDVVSDFTRFEPGTPPAFQFLGRGRDLEQSAFVQDFIRLGKWTVSAGLRWDHYQLLVNQNALSPRFGDRALCSRSRPGAARLLRSRLSNTRVRKYLALQLSGGRSALIPTSCAFRWNPPAATTMNWDSRRASSANANWTSTTSAVPQIILPTTTGCSTPASASRSPSANQTSHGAEGKIEFPHMGKLAGHLDYSYLVASAYLPVTGGLFLGDDASNALIQTIGRFSGLAGPTQHRANPGSISAGTARLGCVGRRIWKRPAH